MGIRHRNLADEMQGVANLTSERGPSKALWQDCPVREYQNMGGGGIMFENDYAMRLGGGQSDLDGVTGTSTTEVDDWIQTEITSGLTTRIEAGNLGLLRVSSEASANDDDGITVMYRATPFAPTDGKKIWFEARVKFTTLDDAQGDENMFCIGLSNTITAAIPSGVLDDTVDKAVFYHQDGDTTGTLAFNTSKTTVQEATTGITPPDSTTFVDGTYYKLGIKCEWKTLAGTSTAYWTAYVNGVEVASHSTSTETPTAGTGLGIIYAAITESETTALMDIDWVRVAAES